ncbi:MAG: HAAAP family serine/threonine permease [Arsenophonus sp. ET-LJ4-MAG3]
MDTTRGDSITSSHIYHSAKVWQKSDIIWVLSLYGTAIGAGVLFLPINAGMNGLLPVILMTLIAFPIIFFSHQGLTRFVLSGSKINGNITDVVEEHFGYSAGNWITIFYFFSIYPILLVYSVFITNNVENFIVELLGYNAEPRWLLALILVSVIMAIISFCEKYIVKIMSMLAFPFIAVLVIFSFYMIPYWQFATLKTLSFSNIIMNNSENNQNMLITIWLTIPLMVFAFNHSPIISAFAVANRKKYGEYADQKSSKILFSAHILMVLTVMFFVFSCIFTLSPADLLKAKVENISILDYLSGYFDKLFIKYAASLIAFIAIIKSFFGHYLGAREGFNGIINRIYRIKGKTIDTKKLNKITAIFMLITTWLVATLNPSILTIIESLGGPIIAILLFLIPIYTNRKIPAMHKYFNYITNTFMLIIGIIVISAAIYKLFI